jgi:hypothetical protein
MMDKIASGLTWEQVQELFNGSEYTLLLNNCNRRASLKKRKNGVAEERTVWRLILQQDHKNFVRTVFRKNLKDVSGEISGQVAGDKIIEQLNNIVAV